jgi:hypothetical protein
MSTIERRSAIWIGSLLLVALAAALVLRGAGPQAAQASSHREAPMISGDPNADNTDLYAFRSPDRPDSVTIVANYIPLEQPAGGPNFASFGDDVLYAINVDNNGDGKEDVSYEFRFKTQTRNPGTFLYNTGPIATLDDPNWNRPQTYTVTRVERPTGRFGHGGTVLGSNLKVPPVNIGPRSTPNYDALAAAAVATVPGKNGEIKVFAGQRDDPFFVDLGSIFDLAGLRPLNSFHLIPLTTAFGVDGVAGYNTHSIAIQVPIKDLAGASPTLGIYASASRQAATILRGDGTKLQAGPFVQVSRLGEPLVNEVLIGLGQKDFWNSSDPSRDSQFAGRYLTPELAALENLLYPVLTDTETANRKDLAAVLLTGVPGLNFTGPTQADLLRLNTSIPVTTSPKRLGVLDGDLQGFPNGRRLTDDTVDIELRAVACAYGAVAGLVYSLTGNCNPGTYNAGTANYLVGDGVDANDKAFGSTFPYLAAPFSGYEAVPPS